MSYDDDYPEPPPNPPACPNCNGFAPQLGPTRKLVRLHRNPAVTLGSEVIAGE